MEIVDYKRLITSEFQDSQKYLAMVGLDVSPFVRTQALLASMIPKFDVDAAVGDQLDIIGQWVGVSRRVSIPIPNVYFSWDGDFTVGWEYGVWQPDNQPTEITVLPDDVYRTLIKAKIAANQWDGTTEGAYLIWEAVFTTLTILIQDHQNMSYDLAIVGGIVDSLTLALITGGYIPLKPEAVRINEVFVPVNNGPLFGWDVDSPLITGWETGSWARELPVT